MIVCFLRYGADFTDYSAFEFWEKNSKERSSYITLRRNDRLRFNLSTPSVYSLFLDKAAFNKRFSKFVSDNPHEASEILLQAKDVKIKSMTVEEYSGEPVRFYLSDYSEASTSSSDEDKEEDSETTTASEEEEAETTEAGTASEEETTAAEE